MIAVAVVVAVAIVTVVAILAARARRRTPAATADSPAAGWTNAAGEDFTGLPEPARCDLVFAMAALDDADSRAVLERALDDPSETVALAAAHALAGRGHAAALQRYFAAHPGARGARIADTLALLADPRD